MAGKKERPAPAKPRTATPPRSATKSKSAPAALPGEARVELSSGELRKLVEEAAYYRAKQRGFEPGHEVEDWVQAEAEVLRRIGADSRSR
jgi:hypothetical protein